MYLKFEKSNKGTHWLINGSQPNHPFFGKETTAKLLLIDVIPRHVEVKI